MERRLRPFVAAAVVLALATGAAAEGFLDLYGGGAFTRDEHVSVQALGGFSRDEEDFESSGVVGGRLGLWLGSVPVLGGALDVSHYQADGKDGLDPADLEIYPISALVMVRVPLLERGDFPEGRVQPYAGVGPSIVVSSFRIPTVIDETEADFGVDARLGVAGMLTTRVGFFFEWRFVHFEPKWDETSQGQPVRYDTEISTHLLQAGISLRF